MQEFKCKEFKFKFVSHAAHPGLVPDTIYGWTFESYQELFLNSVQCGSRQPLSPIMNLIFLIILSYIQILSIYQSLTKAVYDL